MRQENIYSVSDRPLGRNFIGILRVFGQMLLVQMLLQCQFTTLLKGIVFEGLN